MAKLETTEEFVLKLYNRVSSVGQIMIKDEFPELFGVKLVLDPNKEIKESIQRLEEELAELKSKVK